MVGGTELIGLSLGISPPQRKKTTCPLSEIIKLESPGKPIKLQINHPEMNLYLLMSMRG